MPIPDSPRRKFLFDQAFDVAQPNPQAPPPPPTFSEEELAAAKSAAYAEGLQAGRAEQLQSQASELNQLLAQLQKRVGQLLADSASQQNRQDQIASELALVLVGKLMPSYAKQYGTEEISFIIQQTLQELISEPRLVVRVAEEIFDAVNATISQLSQKTAFPGKVIVLAEAEMGPSDIKIEWADGGLERNLGTLMQEIEQAIGRAQGAWENRPIGKAVQTETSPTTTLSV